jgi:hypothetical protein
LITDSGSPLQQAFWTYEQHREIVVEEMGIDLPDNLPFDRLVSKHLELLKEALNFAESRVMPPLRRGRRIDYRRRQLCQDVACWLNQLNVPLRISLDSPYHRIVSLLLLGADLKGQESPDLRAQCKAALTHRRVDNMFFPDFSYGT